MKLKIPGLSCSFQNGWPSNICDEEDEGKFYVFVFMFFPQVRIFKMPGSYKTQALVGWLFWSILIERDDNYYAKKYSWGK